MRQQAPFKKTAFYKFLTDHNLQNWLEIKGSLYPGRYFLYHLSDGGFTYRNTEEITLDFVANGSEYFPAVGAVIVRKPASDIYETTFEILSGSFDVKDVVKGKLGLLSDIEFYSEGKVHYVI